MAINDDIRDNARQARLLRAKASVGAICLFVGLFLGQNMGSQNVFDIGTKIKRMSVEGSASASPTIPVKKAPGQ